MSAADLPRAAEQALAAMRAAGFEHAQVQASTARLTELNFNDNEPTLLRSTDSAKLALRGIVDGRMASTELADLALDALRARAEALFDDARAAPQDAANAVSSAQRARIALGPTACDDEALVEAVSGLLAFRRERAARFTLAEGAASHQHRTFCLLTSGGSEIAGDGGWYELGFLGSAREGARASSINYGGGCTHDLRSAPAHELFGLGDLMRDTARQVDTQPLGEKFVGDVVLTPAAVNNLLAWLVGQLSDTALIAGTSLFRDKAGTRIAAEHFTLRSRFDAPGVLPVSADGFVTPAVTVVERGVLRTTLPTLYGSRRTGLPHVPVPSGAGWEIDAGELPLSEMVGSVQRGALVGRLSMGLPAANGDFSGVVKNSFLLRGGETGPALAETMITGNMAQMLQGIVAASRERLAGESWRLPWLRISGLHFS